jgi:ribosomal protein L40E
VLEADNRSAVQLSELATRARPFAPLGVILAAIAAGYARGLGVGLLVLAGGMLLFAISALWESVQSLADDSALSLDEALALASPSAEEERKRAVLRALKDLDYERSVGKVSEEDYQKLSSQYREEAKRLLQVLDLAQSPARARAEKLADEFVEKELAKQERAHAEQKLAQATDEEDEDEEVEERPAEAAAADTDDEDEPDEDADETADETADEDATDEPGETASDDDDADDDEDEHAESRELVCASCETKNDADARFCKKCGESLT